MNNNIFPCLWYDRDAKESADFYCTVFSGEITAGTPMVVNIEIFGQKLMLLNGGPHFTKNASVSFMVICETEDEVQKYWDHLTEGGIVLMELGEYPWSKKYGWVRDKFGVTWQVYLSENNDLEQKIIPTLMFIHQNNGKAMKAMEFYTNIFPDSKIGSILKYGDGIGNETHEIPENIQHAHFEINGYSFFCMDNSYDHQFDFNEGISMVVMTDNQEQTDHYWNNLTNGGRESMCGWLKDQFGFSWQIVPKRLIELMNDSDQEKAHKVVISMMKMRKIIIQDLENAYNS